MIVFGIELAFGLFIGILCLGIAASLLRLAYEHFQRRAEDKRLADRWKENANPSIGQL